MRILSRKVWTIDARNHLNQSLPEGDLLVLAPTLSKAAEKASKYLQKNYPNHKIKNVYFEGELDIL